jgi:hypothetical protein
MGGCPARPFGQCLFPGDGNGSPPLVYPPFRGACVHLYTDDDCGNVQPECGLPPLIGRPL